MTFAGKVLLATGAGSGIAAEVARGFAAAGGYVALLDRDYEKAIKVASDLEHALPVACDVSNEVSVQRAVDDAVRHFGRIDCVLNSAGHVINKPIDNVSVEEWNKMLAVHITGTFLICKTS